MKRREEEVKQERNEIAVLFSMGLFSPVSPPRVSFSRSYVSRAILLQLCFAGNFQSNVMRDVISDGNDIRVLQRFNTLMDKRNSQ